jgi:hypothetical protein
VARRPDVSPLELALVIAWAAEWAVVVLIVYLMFRRK